MKLSDTILPEFDREMANTRKTIERVPDDKLDWKPHEKSMTLRSLTTHLATLPHWAVFTITDDSFDLAPPDAPPRKATPVNSTQEAVETFDKNIVAAREAISGASDEQLLGQWTLLNGGKTIFTMPRIAVIRNVVMNHNIHHRAQLGVYLRLNDIAVPSIYGPSADEGAF